MSILKLQVGEPITMAVAKVRAVDGQFGPQLAFDSESGDTLFLGQETAERQLERIGYTTESVAGKALLFEKVQKGTKTFVNINPASKAGAAKASGANGGAGAASSNGVGHSNGNRVSESPARQSAALSPVYMEALVEAKKIVAASGLKAVSSDNVLSVAACLFIEHNKSGRPITVKADKPAVTRRQVEEEFDAEPVGEEAPLPF